MSNQTVETKLDLLVITAHPDDRELGCSGTILKHVALGKRVGIVDLTRGELGTRGTPESRAEEAANSAKVLGVAVRENLGLRDGFFRVSEEDIKEVVRVIRRFQPEIIISNALFDRHPDHGRGGDLVYEACFYSGLRKIETYDGNGMLQGPHRPRLLLQSIQDYYIKPDIVVDVSDFWEKKLSSIKAFKSQFFNDAYQSDEPETYISRPGFVDLIEARAREYGKYIGVTYAEGYTSRRILGVENLFQLV